jgi:hypothetical protein
MIKTKFTMRAWGSNLVRPVTNVLAELLRGRFSDLHQSALSTSSYSLYCRLLVVCLLRDYFVKIKCFK